MARDGRGIRRMRREEERRAGGRSDPPAAGARAGSGGASGEGRRDPSSKGRDGTRPLPPPPRRRRGHRPRRKGRPGRGHGRPEAGRPCVCLSFEESPGLLSASSSVVSSLRSRASRLFGSRSFSPARSRRVSSGPSRRGPSAARRRSCCSRPARSQRAHVAALRTRLPRLSRIAAEATKQCDRTIVPGIEGPEEIGTFLRREEERGDARLPLLLADPSGAPLARTISSPSVSASLARGLAVAIGPEGGIHAGGALLIRRVRRSSVLPRPPHPPPRDRRRRGAHRLGRRGGSADGFAGDFSVRISRSSDGRGSWHSRTSGRSG